jgi:hypothetical protein
VVEQLVEQLDPVEARDLGRELLQLDLDVDGVEPVELADDGVLVAEELVERPDRHPGPQRHLLGGERLETDLHEVGARGPQDVVETPPTPILRGPSPRQELRGVACLGGHGPRLLRGTPLIGAIPRVAAAD